MTFLHLVGALVALIFVVPVWLIAPDHAETIVRSVAGVIAASCAAIGVAAIVIRVKALPPAHTTPEGEPHGRND